MSPVLGGWGTYATLIAFGLAVCLIGYLAIGDYDSMFVAQHDAPATPGTHGSERGEAAARPLPSLLVDTDVPAESAAAVEDFNALLDASGQALRDSPERRPVRDPTAALSPLPTTEARFASVEPALPPVAPEPVAPAVAIPATAAPEPVVPDRWQLLASALSRCERENLVAGLICKERARLQYCEGEWGNAPQCPAGVASNSTR